MLLRKITCNWAHGKRRGFSPGAAARHRGLTRALVHPSCQGKWTMIALIVHFPPRSRTSQTSDPEMDRDVALGLSRSTRGHKKQVYHKRDRTSPPVIQLHIGRLLPVSDFGSEVRSEIRRHVSQNERSDLSPIRDRTLDTQVSRTLDTQVFNGQSSPISK